MKQRFLFVMLSILVLIGTTFGVPGSGDGYAVLAPEKMSRTATVTRIDPLVKLNFDESVGATVYNLTPSSVKFGTLYNGATVAAGGRFCKGMHLDGHNDYFRLNGAAVRGKITNRLTVYAAINPASYENVSGMKHQRIVSQWYVEGYNRRAFSLSIIDGYPHLAVSFANDDTRTLQSGTRVPLNVFTTVAGVYDGAYLRIYVNKTLTDNLYVGGGTIQAGDGDVIIGRRDGTGSTTDLQQSFKGIIDEVSIYNVSMSTFGREYKVLGPSVVTLNQNFPVHVTVFRENGEVYFDCGDTVRFHMPAGMSGLPSTYTFTPGYPTVTFNGVKCNAAGTYRILVEKVGDNIVREGNPIVCLTASSDKVYWGDMHWHSDIAANFSANDKHADRTPDDGYAHARIYAKLDFCAMAEHGFRFKSPGADWQRCITAANNYNANHSFITLLGHEWAGRNGGPGTYSNPDDHYIVRYYGMPYEKNVGCPPYAYPGAQYILGFTTPFYAETDTLTELMGKVAQYSNNFTVTPHHLRYHSFFRNYAPTSQQAQNVPYVEIYSKWGASEYVNNPRKPLSQNVTNPVTVMEILNRGFKVGFVAGSDSHRTYPGSCLDEKKDNLIYRQGGLTAALSNGGLYRDSIWSALTTRKTYATTGERIYVDFKVNNTHMGGQTSVSSSTVPIYFKVEGTTKLDTIQIIRNGYVIKTFFPGSASYTATYYNTPVAGTNYYYLRVIQADREMAWASPVWVTK